MTKLREHGEFKAVGLKAEGCQVKTEYPQPNPLQPFIPCLRV
jgi:hypothetical protein